MFSRTISFKIDIFQYFALMYLTSSKQNGINEKESMNSINIIKTSKISIDIEIIMTIVHITLILQKIYNDDFGRPNYISKSFQIESHSI